MAHHRQARRAEQHLPDLPAVPRGGAEPRRKRLAVPSRQLTLKPRLRHLRRHHRRRLRRLAQTPRPARNHHLNRIGEWAHIGQTP
jgi:hypothetical protein